MIGVLPRAVAALAAFLGTVEIGTATRFSLDKCKLTRIGPGTRGPGAHCGPYPLSRPLWVAVKIALPYPEDLVARRGHVGVVRPVTFFLANLPRSQRPAEIGVAVPIVSVQLNNESVTGNIEVDRERPNRLLRHERHSHRVQERLPGQFELCWEPPLLGARSTAITSTTRERGRRDAPLPVTRRALDNWTTFHSRGVGASRRTEPPPRSRGRKPASLAASLAGYAGRPQPDPPAPLAAKSDVTVMARPGPDGGTAGLALPARDSATVVPTGHRTEPSPRAAGHERLLAPGAPLFHGPLCGDSTCNPTILRSFCERRWSFVGAATVGTNELEMLCHETLINDAIDIKQGVATHFSSKDRSNPHPILACDPHRPRRQLDDRRDLAVAHRTLPCRARVLVCLPRTGRCTVATVLDRGPFGRTKRGGYRALIDLAPRVSKRLRHNGYEQSVVVRLP